MSEIAERYRNVAGQFTQRAKSVSAAAWERPAPCEGWVARDIVRHMVAWMPGFFLAARGLPYEPGPSVDDDPVGAWECVNGAIQAALDGAGAGGAVGAQSDGSASLEEAVATFGIGDVLIHTWDLARAVGLDETLDVGEVHRLVDHLDELDRLLRPSPHFGPRLEVTDDADHQTRLLAFTGRQP